MKNNKISKLSGYLLFAVTALFILAIFQPLWSIELSAPQYPEGMKLLIGAKGIGGDIDSVNKLNHYIGMQEIHSDNFFEFTILPYILGFFALLSLICAITRKKKGLLWTFILFVVFALVSLVDFYKWNYNYGHNLNPEAAIKIPGMSYQPPLIGYKQLLNFGAYSMPSVGGILLLIVAVIFIFIIVKDFGLLGKIRKKRSV